jgi:hypothetical protein
MAIDSEKFLRPAIRGDVTGVAINASRALDSVADALQALKDGNDPASHIAKIKEASRALEAIFDELAGWKPD